MALAISVQYFVNSHARLRVNDSNVQAWYHIVNNKISRYITKTVISLSPTTNRVYFLITSIMVSTYVADKSVEITKHCALGLIHVEHREVSIRTQTFIQKYS